MKHYLTVYVNNTKTKTYLLNSMPSFSYGKITIGRLPANDIVLPYPSVSRSHAYIEIKGDVADIVDSGSLNKLRVNGTAYERIRLVNGLKVTIGTSSNTITLCYNAIEDAVLDSAYATQQKNAYTPSPKTVMQPHVSEPPGSEISAADYSNRTETVAPKRRSEKKQPGCFGRRFFAFLADSVICMFMTIGVFVLMFLALNPLIKNKLVIGFFTFIASMLVCWIYYALGESGDTRATMGKLALGLWVVNAKTHERITFAHASRRFYSKILSGIILFIGFFPIFGKGQTLHDYLSGTNVIRNPRMSDDV